MGAAWGWKVAGLLIFALATAVAYQNFTLEALIALQTYFRAAIEDRPVGSFVSFVALYVLVVSTSVPGAALLTLTGGLIFGWLVGGVAAVIAATAGASIVFFVATTTVGSSLAARVGPQAEKLRKGFCDDALSFMLFLRLTPAFPFFIVNIVPALLGVPFRTFLLGTFFGVIPASFAISFAGHGLDSAILSAQAAKAQCVASAVVASCPLTLRLGNLITPQLTMTFVALGVLALLPIGLKFWRRRYDA